MFDADRRERLHRYEGRRLSDELPQLIELIPLTTPSSGCVLGQLDLHPINNNAATTAGIGCVVITSRL